MVVRGFLTAAIALIALRGTLRHVDRYTYLIALTGPFALLGLYEGIRHLGAGPAIGTDRIELIEAIENHDPDFHALLPTFLDEEISRATRRHPVNRADPRCSAHFLPFRCAPLLPRPAPRPARLNHSAALRMELEPRIDLHDHSRRVVTGIARIWHAPVVL
jgi:hypothetical protein